ncbi:hypothetical protein V8E36_007609 [Tilletia maclaganii]
MSRPKTPARPSVTVSSTPHQHHQPQHPQRAPSQTSSQAQEAGAPSPTQAATAVVSDTVNIPLDEPEPEPQSARQYYYQHHDPNSSRHQQSHHAHTHPSQPHEARLVPHHHQGPRYLIPQQNQQNPESKQSQLSRQSSQVALPHTLVPHTSLSPSDPFQISPRHIKPTFFALHHPSANSASPVLHAFSSTLSSAFTHVTAGISGATKAVTAAQGGIDHGSAHRLVSDPVSTGIPYHTWDSDDKLNAAGVSGITRSNLPRSSNGPGMNYQPTFAPARPGQEHQDQQHPAQSSQTAAIAWTTWSIRPAGRILRSAAGGEYEWHDVERAPALIIGYTSGALQVYVCNPASSASGPLQGHSLGLDEVIFLPRFPRFSVRSQKPSSVTGAEKSRTPTAARRVSGTHPADGVYGAIFLSPDRLLVLVESHGDATEAGSSTRKLELIVLSLANTPSESHAAAQDKASAVPVPQAIACFKIRDLARNEAVVSAELRASGTDFLAVALSTTNHYDPFTSAPPTAEIHALKIRSAVSSRISIHHVCAPLTDLPPGVRPTLDLCGRVLAYAACVPTFNARDRAVGGNFVAAAGAFGSQNAADFGTTGLPGEGMNIGAFDESGAGYGGTGLSKAGGVAAGGAAAAVMSLGHRAAAAGISSMSALTAAAAARFSPSSIGSGAGGLSHHSYESAAGPGSGSHPHAAGWEQHASAAASAISIGAGAGVDVAKRVSSGVLSGVKGLSGYFGNAQAQRNQPSLAASSSPPFAASQLSRSAPNSQGVLHGAGFTSLSSGPPGRVVAGFTPAPNNASSVERASSPYGNPTTQQRRFSGGKLQHQHRHSISQRPSSRLGLNAGKTATSALPSAVEDIIQSSTDSPLLQPSSHEELGLGHHSVTGMQIAGPAAAASDAASNAGTSVGSKRHSGHSLSGVLQAFGQGPIYPFGTSVGSGAQPSSFSQLHGNPPARSPLSSGPVWVRVVDLASVTGYAVDSPAESLPRPRTLALFRPPNSSMGLLGQVGLGWTAGTNAAAAASGQAPIGVPSSRPAVGGGGAALLSSSLPRSPPHTGGPEYSTSFSTTRHGPSSAGPLPPFSPGSSPLMAGTSAGLGPNPVALLSLGPDGSSLLTADALGQMFHVWEMTPCPAPVNKGTSADEDTAGENTLDTKSRGARVSSHGSHGGAVSAFRAEEESLPPPIWHRYKLPRGHTPAHTVAASWSPDGQFVFVQSQKGTIHGYPVNSHGGTPDIAKHLQQSTTTARQAHAEPSASSTLSLEVKAIARLRPTEVSSTQSLVQMPGTESYHLSLALPTGARSGVNLVPSLAQRSMTLLSRSLYTEPASRLVADDIPARQLQFLVFHPARDAMFLHSFACAASAAAEDGAASSLITGLPRALSAPVAAAASGAAAVASSGLSRVMSRSTSNWGSPPAAGGGRSGDKATPASGASLATRKGGRIFSWSSGANTGQAHGLVGDSVALAAWCGLARTVLLEQSPNLDETADNFELELDEELAFGDDAEALEKRALIRAYHMRHGSSPLAQPAVDITASQSSSPSASDEGSGTPAKSNGITATHAPRSQAQMHARLQAEEVKTGGYSSSVEMASSHSLGGEEKKTTATSSPLTGGKKKRKGSTKTLGGLGEAAIPVLELPPPTTIAPPTPPKLVKGDLLKTDIGAFSKSREQEWPRLPAFTPPSWVTQIEVETYNRAPRLLPSSIWLSHQFDFRGPSLRQGTLSGQLHTLYRQDTSKLQVREEVQLDVPGSDGDPDFDKGLTSAIGNRAFDRGALDKFQGQNNAGAYNDTSSSATRRIPMFPQGQRARHPAWHERVVAAGGVPIRNVAGGLGHGLGRAGREIGRTVEEAMTARRKHLSASSVTGEAAGFEAFDFDDEGQRSDDDAAAAGTASFLDVRAAKEAAGLSVEDLPAAEIDSDDEQTWKDARRANQGLDDEFEGWDGFATEGCAPPVVNTTSTDGYMASLLKEDGGIGAPSSSRAAAAAGSSGAALTRGTPKVSASSAIANSALPSPASASSGKMALSGKTTRSGMPGALPLPTATPKSSSSSVGSGRRREAGF